MQTICFKTNSTLTVKAKTSRLQPENNSNRSFLNHHINYKSHEMKNIVCPFYLLETVPVTVIRNICLGKIFAYKTQPDFSSNFKVQIWNFLKKTVPLLKKTTGIVIFTGCQTIAIKLSNQIDKVVNSINQGLATFNGLTEDEVSIFEDIKDLV